MINEILDVFKDVYHIYENCYLLSTKKLLLKVMQDLYKELGAALCEEQICKE